MERQGGTFGEDSLPRKGNHEQQAAPVIFNRKGVGCKGRGGIHE